MTPHVCISRRFGLKILFLAPLLPFFSLAQSSFVPLNEEYYHKIDRYEVKAGKVFSEIFTTVKPYKRASIVEFLDTVQAEGLISSRSDHFNETYFRDDSWEWGRPESSNSKRPVLRHFYKKKSDLFYVDVPDFDLHINPVVYVGAGTDSRLDGRLFINTRGVEVRGMIDQKVGFYTYLADNQAKLPAYVQDYLAQYFVVPHEGFWKSFKNGGVDFLQARGYITYDASRHINLQLGHDRFFFGNGYRSLIMSDFAPPMLFFKGNVSVWKINYQYSINQLKADAPGTLAGSRSMASGYPDKFIAFHHLSVNIGKKLNVGLFETVIFSPDDSLGTGRFQFGYINPIIFYRAIEQQNGSSDNVILGGDFKWNALKGVSLYGQFVLDEFVLKNIRAGNGWWANKFGLQGGAKYVDAFGVSNLDLQAEMNVMRPYTYSHNTWYANYSGFRQSMAHPLGANFREIVGILRYQPIERLSVTGKLVFTKMGRDTTGVNWGSDVLKSYVTRQRFVNFQDDYNNSIGQGIANTILFGSFTASWMLKHNLFVDLQVIVRKSSSDVALYDNQSVAASVALRWNIAQRLYDF